MAKAYLMRLDQLLSLCDTSQINDDAIKWYKAIICLYKEIQPKMKAEEKKTAAQKITILTEAKNKGLQTGQINQAIFIDAELYLRGILEEKGMLTPKGDDPSKAYRG